MYIKLLYLIILIQIITVKCNDRPEASIKNLTDVEKAKPKPKNNDDPFKKDLRKYMRECGVSIAGDSDDDDNGGEKNSEEHSAEEVAVPKGQKAKDEGRNGHWAYEKKRGGGKGGTYPSHYGKKKGGGRRGGSDEDSEEDEDEEEYRGSSNRRKGGSNRNKNNRKGNKKGRPSDDYDESREDCEDSGMKKGSGGRKGFNSGQYGGMGWSTRGGSGGGGRYNTKSYGGYSGYYGSDPFGQGQKTEYGVIYSSPDIWATKGFSTYGGRLMAMSGVQRAKRENEDEKCVSQCVFGYMEMLDDNRVPSETEVIRYFQDKILNTSERIRLIKLARKCFAMLSTTEITDSENGCQFSKNLAKCLQVDVKEEA